MMEITQEQIDLTDSPGIRANQSSQLHPRDLKYIHLRETNDPFALENYWKLRVKDQCHGKEIFKLSQHDIDAFKGFYAKAAKR